MKINKNSYIFSILFTFLGTVILVFPLTLANMATKPIADDYWRVQRYVKTLISLGLPGDAAKPDESKRQYAELEKYTLRNGQLVQVSDKEIDAAEVAAAPITPLYYVTNVNGERRYAGSFTGPGLWGNVSLAFGVNQMADVIQGLQVLFQVETPGLGGRIGEKWFSDQFKGLKPGPNGIEFNVSGLKKTNGIDGIAGATITSTAVRDIVNKAIPDLKALIAKMGGNK